MKNILVDAGSEKRQESIGDAQIFWIFGHQQPCRYGEKIYIYKIEDSYFVCVCCLCFSKVFTVLKFPRSYFLTFFTMMSFLEVLFIQSSFSDTILWWFPSLTFLLKSSSPARILPHSNKNFWWIVDPQMKISFQKMIQEIRQTSVFDARRTTLFCPDGKPFHRNFESLCKTVAHVGSTFACRKFLWLLSNA